MGVSQTNGYHFGGPNNKDYSILGSMFGSPYLGKLPYRSFLGYMLIFSRSIWVVVKIMGPFLGTLNIRCRIMIMFKYLYLP